MTDKNEEPSKKYRIKGDITIVNARTGEKAEHKIDRTIGSVSLWGVSRY